MNTFVLLVLLLSAPTQAARILNPLLEEMEREVAARGFAPAPEPPSIRFPEPEAQVAAKKVAAPRSKPAPLPARQSMDPSQAVSRLCGSPFPVLIVDDFVSEDAAPAIDVDGDGRPDVEHGDVIAALYKAHGRRFLIRDLQGRRGYAHVAEVLNEVADDSAAGRLRISAVNLSHTVDVTWQGLNNDLGLKPPVTPANIHTRRADLARAVVTLMTRNDNEEFGDIDRALSRLAAAGVPVFVSAGNHTPDKVNLLGLLPGAVSVGALDRSLGKAAFSADNSLVSVWAPGEHVFRRVPGGVDIDGDGHPDIPTERLTGGPTLLSRFAGRPLAEVRGVMPSDPWLVNIDRKHPNGVLYLQSQMSDGLYPVEELSAFFLLSPAKARSFATRGRWFDKTMEYPFEVDASGNVVFDPARDGSAGQAVLIPGTSFATPLLCRKPAVY